MEKKTVVITGGSRGLGRAMALALAAAGHRVAVTGRDADKLAAMARELPGGMAISADVREPTQVAAVIDQVEESLGPVDVLINNAGAGGGAKGPQTLVDTDADEWWRLQETNLRGPMLYTKAVLPGMIARKAGIIINLGSYIAIRPSPLATAYAASKAALARFTDCLAEEVSEHGVQVFCVSPGLVLTDMTRDLDFIKDIPAEAFNQPEDIAALACELVSGRYGALSGRFIHVTDDLNALRDSAEKISQERLYQLSLHGLHGLIA